MHPIDVVGEAASGITRRRGRSLLTALGTVLGVGAFVAGVGLTTTAAAQIGARFDALKATEVRIEDTQPDALDDGAFPADTEQRLSRLNGVVRAGLLWQVAAGADVDRLGPLAVEGDTAEAVPLLAASPGALAASAASISHGRRFDGVHDERRERVVVLGRGAARRLGITDVAEQPAVSVRGVTFTVLGVIDDVDRNVALVGAVVVPHATALELWGPPRETPMAVTVATEAGAAQLVGREAPAALRPHGPDRLRVVVPPDPRTLRGNVENDVRTLLLLLSSVSLVIGGVGIANTTLVSVLERTNEIGLRRAVGAGRGAIASQFLLESTLLGTAGGAVGAALGVLVVVVVALTRRWVPVMDVTLAFGAPLVGTLSGLLAGAYPALRAARVEPVDALRR